MSTIFCTNCGAQLKQQACFCVACGMHVISNPIHPPQQLPSRQIGSNTQRRSRPPASASKRFLLLTAGLVVLSIILFKFLDTLWSFTSQVLTSYPQPQVALKQPYQFHNATALRWSPDGQYLADWTSTSGNNGVIQVWKLATQELITNYPGLLTVNAFAWSADGRYIASANMNQLDSSQAGNNLPAIIKVWDAKSGHTLKSYQGPTASVDSLSWSPDGRYVTVAGLDQQNGRIVVTIRTWDITSSSQSAVSTITDAPLGNVTGLSWSPDAKRLIGAGGSTIVWDVSSGATVFSLPNHEYSEYLAAWSPNGKMIVLSGSHSDYSDPTKIKMSNTIRLLDAATGTVLSIIPSGTTESVQQLAWSADSQHLMAVTNKVKVWNWDVTTKGTHLGCATDIPTFKLGGKRGQHAQSFALSPDGKTMALSFSETIDIQKVIC